MRRSAAIELFWKLHPLVYRASRGRLLGRLVGMDVLLLTTTGARSGRARTTALTAFADGGAWVVIGSCLGEPRNPGWVHNLRAHPDATIQVGARRQRVRAREARGEERARLWQRAVALQPDYAAYAARTGREIPVVVLAPNGVDALGGAGG